MPTYTIFGERSVITHVSAVEALRIREERSLGGVSTDHISSSADLYRLRYNAAQSSDSIAEAYAEEAA